MKARILLILFLFPVFLSNAQSNSADRKKEELSRKYFNLTQNWTTPAELQYLLEKNTGIIPDTIISRTGTSLYYMRGFTGSFNPFNIPARQIEIQVRESTGRTINKTGEKDTLLFLLIIAITDSSRQNAEMLRKEVKRLVREIAPAFTYTRYDGSVKKAKRPYEGYSFIYQTDPYPHITVGWTGYYKNSSVHCLNLALVYKYSRE